MRPFLWEAVAKLFAWGKRKNCFIMNYIRSINIKHLLKFQDVLIRVTDGEELRHLIITGANGSGKTSLLKAILSSWDAMASNSQMEFVGLADTIEETKNRLKYFQDHNDEKFLSICSINLKNQQELYERVYGQVVLDGPDYITLWNKVRQGNFILACYSDFRMPQFVEIKNPEKPNLSYSKISESKVDQFLRFMADLKIQQALANNEGMRDDAAQIEEWFTSFEDILKQIFNDPSLQLKFNYKDYSFLICNDGKEFKFTQLSAGYAAALDIVVDLMLKMQQVNALRRVYDMEGIVLIDEIETHLHLQLQKQILPILTSVFPRIQFIVTSHSPFVLNSLKSATVFDLEQQQTIEDLTEYSYEAITEGYFGVHTESSYIGLKLDQLKELLSKESLQPDEKLIAQHLVKEFEGLSEIASPRYVGEYRQLIINKGGILK